MILVVVAVLYVLTNKDSPYKRSMMGNRRYNNNRYGAGYQQKANYKSNASADLSPKVYNNKSMYNAPAQAPEMTTASGYSVNAYRDDHATKISSGYKTNAMVNRKATARPFTSGYETVQPAPMKSAYGYGMAKVNF
jgi:hypothetical protein